MYICEHALPPVNCKSKPTEKKKKEKKKIK